MLSCKFCEISKNTVFHRTPLMAASISTKNMGTRPRFNQIESINRRKDCQKAIHQILNPLTYLFGKNPSVIFSDYFWSF